MRRLKPINFRLLSFMYQYVEQRHATFVDLILIRYVCVFDAEKEIYALHWDGSGTFRAKTSSSRDGSRNFFFLPGPFAHFSIK